MLEEKSLEVWVWLITLGSSNDAASEEDDGLDNRPVAMKRAIKVIKK